jgi:hypothetical protein
MLKKAHKVCKHFFGSGVNSREVERELPVSPKLFRMVGSAAPFCIKYSATSTYLCVVVKKQHIRIKGEEYAFGTHSLNLVRDVRKCAFMCCMFQSYQHSMSRKKKDSPICVTKVKRCVSFDVLAICITPTPARTKIRMLFRPMQLQQSAAKAEKFHLFCDAQQMIDWNMCEESVP